MYNKNRRLDFINSGLCAICGKNTPYNGTRRCKICADKNSARDRKRKGTPERYKSIKSSQLQRKYGIDLAQYNELLQKQDGRCALCKTSFREDETPFVDHDHGTNRIRGLLHNRCNLALGLFRDDPNLLILAIEYLGRNI